MWNALDKFFLSKPGLIVGVIILIIIALVTGDYAWALIETMTLIAIIFFPLAWKNFNEHPLVVLACVAGVIIAILWISSSLLQQVTALPNILK